MPTSVSKWSNFHNNNLCNWSSFNQSSINLRFIPVNGGGQIYLTLTAISPTSTLHLAQFMASSFSKPTLLLSFSTCLFHFFFGLPCFLLLFTSNSNTFLKIMPIIPSQHMPVPSHSTHLCHLNHCFLQSIQREVLLHVHNYCWVIFLVKLLMLSMEDKTQYWCFFIVYWVNDVFQHETVFTQFTTKWQIQCFIEKFWNLFRHSLLGKSRWDAQMWLELFCLRV